MAYRLTNHLFIPDKSFVVSFDDGRDDGYYYAYPILKKYGFVATYFVITNREDTATNLSWDQAAEMAKNGMEIASHTEDHTDIALSHGTALVNEVTGSKLAIETNLASRGVTVTVTTFCYPYGDVTSEGEQYIKTHGYLAAFTENDGAVRPGQNMYELPRVRVGRGESGATLLLSVAQS
jgi:peptidoglycan/xylan/chitin deacetylase (PgdA/CDA1 family)